MPTFQPYQRLTTETKPTCIAQLSGVAALTVAVGVSRVRDLAAAMLAAQAAAGVEQLPLLVAQGAVITLGAFAVIRLADRGDALSMDTPGKEQDAV